MTDVSGNVEAISTYTIGASGTVTLAVYNVFAALAEDQINLDDPGFTTEQKNEAQALYICHLIAQKKGQTGKTSLSIGKYSYSKKLESGLTSWLDEYHALIERVKNPDYGVQNLSLEGITRDDANMNGLGLDQSTPYDLADEERI